MWCAWENPLEEGNFIKKNFSQVWDYYKAPPHLSPAPLTSHNFKVCLGFSRVLCKLKRFKNEIFVDGVPSERGEEFAVTVNPRSKSSVFIGETRKGNEMLKYGVLRSVEAAWNLRVFEVNAKLWKLRNSQISPQQKLFPLSRGRILQAFDLTICFEWFLLALSSK